MPQRLFEAQVIESSKIKTNTIDCGKVQISNSSQPFTVTNSEGKVVFFVDEKGVTEHITNTTTSFVELYDTPKELGKENTILGIKNGKLAFVDDINADIVQIKKLTCQAGNVYTLKSETLDVHSCCVTDLKSEKSFSKASTIENLNASSIMCNELNVTKFDPDTLKCNSAHIQDLKTTAFQADLISSHNLASTHAVLENLEAHKSKLGDVVSKTLHTDSIKAKDVTTDNIKAKLVTFTDVKSDTVDAEVIKANKVCVKQNTYGSEKEPLNLAVTQSKDVKVEGNNIKIVTTCPAGVLTQSFTIYGLNVNEDYIAHVTSNNDVMLQYLLINDGNRFTLKINYADRTMRNTVLKIYIQHM